MLFNPDTVGLHNLTPSKSFNGSLEMSSEYTFCNRYKDVTHSFSVVPDFLCKNVKNLGTLHFTGTNVRGDVTSFKVRV